MPLIESCHFSSTNLPAQGELTEKSVTDPLVRARLWPVCVLGLRQYGQIVSSEASLREVSLGSSSKSSLAMRRECLLIDMLLTRPYTGCCGAAVLQVRSSLT